MPPSHRPPRASSGSRVRPPPITCVTVMARRKGVSAADAWREFVHLYGPVVYGFARGRGLPDADAAELMQVVLRSVARDAATPGYDPERGTVRAWVYAATRNTIDAFLDRTGHQPVGIGNPVHERLDAVPTRPGDGPDEEWEREYKQRLTGKAMEVVRREVPANSWLAFWGITVEGRPAEAVAADLGMTPGAACAARCRILARLRGEVRRLAAEDQ